MSTDILNSNFFELFGLPVSYDVDLDRVQQQYMSLQKVVHPDRFANASDQEKRLSMQQTSWINEAQSTLKDPVARAIYMLKLSGIDFDLENETTMDAAFLMQQLEMRERLESIRHESDPLSALDELAREVRQTTRSMAAGFVESYDKQQFDASMEWVRKMQFMLKARNEIDALSATIEDEMMS